MTKTYKWVRFNNDNGYGMIPLGKLSFFTKASIRQKIGERKNILIEARKMSAAIKLTFFLILALSCDKAKEQVDKVTHEVYKQNSLFKYSDICFFELSENSIKRGDEVSFFLADSYSWSDILKVEFLGKTITERLPSLSLRPIASSQIHATATMKDGKTRSCSRSIVVEAKNHRVFCSLSSNVLKIGRADQEIDLTLSVGGKDTSRVIKASIQGLELSSTLGGQKSFLVDKSFTFIGHLDFNDGDFADCTIEIDQENLHGAICKSTFSAEDLASNTARNEPLIAEHRQKQREQRDRLLTTDMKLLTPIVSAESYAQANEICKSLEQPLETCLINEDLEPIFNGALKSGIVSVGELEYEYLFLGIGIFHEAFSTPEENFIFLSEAIAKPLEETLIELCTCIESRQEQLYWLAGAQAPSPSSTLLIFKKKPGDGRIQILGEKIHSIDLKFHKLSGKIVPPQAGEIRPICQSNWNVQS